MWSILASARSLVPKPLLAGYVTPAGVSVIG